jgi:flavin-dependent dehydrogenase
MSDYSLSDNAKIAVIGGGPSGSLFSIFALKMAKMIDKKIDITIFEPKDFTKDGPAGCNHCGGVISEMLIQSLAVEGINVPPEVVQRGIDSYVLHTEKGDVYIESPALEKRIATVYRGGGPKGTTDKDRQSFDDFLLKCAVREGASHVPARIDGIRRMDKPVLSSLNEDIMEADLVVGAFGINSTAWKLFEDNSFGYKKPSSTSAFISELELGKETVSGSFGSAIHFFLLPRPGNIKFAALIPKGRYVTLCILGNDISRQTVQELLDSEAARKLIPGDIMERKPCQCFPKLNLKNAEIPFTDRMVALGDAGSTRLFKDGLGACYRMGKAVAKTVVLHGVGREDFTKYYLPVYRRTARDNLYGKCLYLVTDRFKENSLFTESMVEVIKKEQKRKQGQRILSSILWDMFTGNETYRNVFFRGLKPRMHADFGWALTKSIIRRIL